MNSNKLKAKMVEKGYTQTSLAQRVDMSPSNLNYKLSGKGKFDIEEVVKICQVLGIDKPQEKCEIFLQN